MSTISIIVPVYNVEKYLSKCIDSILAQTYTDFELLLIDDGSPDRSGAICDEYATRDPRIRVFHKPNGGVSSARNMGLDNARGEWITFIDADDYIIASFLSDFQFEKCESDIILQGYCNGYNGVIKDKIFFDASETGNSISEVFCNGERKKLLNSPVSKLLKQKIIRDNKLRFDSNTSYGEDHLFVLDYFLFCESASISEFVGYVYNHRPESLTTRKIPYKEVLYYSCRIKEKQEIIIKKNRIEKFNDYVDEQYAKNIIKTIMLFFKFETYHCRKDFNNILPKSDLSPIFKSNSFIMNCFKYGFRLPLIMQYSYFKCLTHLYFCIKH